MGVYTRYKNHADLIDIINDIFQRCKLYVTTLWYDFIFL